MAALGIATMGGFGNKEAICNLSRWTILMLRLSLLSIRDGGETLE